MKTFIKPLWWFPVFLIPQVLLFLYEFSIYSIVKTEQDDLKIWAFLAGMQFVVFAASFLYIGFTLLKNKTIHWLYPIVMLVVELLLLCWFFQHDHDFVSWSVPNWMVDREEFFLLIIAFTMPVLFFSILQLVSYSIKEQGKKQLPLSILFTLAIPLFWYLYFILVLPFLNRTREYDPYRLLEHASIVIAIVSIVVFFFFLIRSLIMLGRMMADKPVVRIIMVLVCCLIAPLGGLWFNDKGDSFGGSNLFGDFSHWSFYVLTVLNAALLLIPPIRQKGIERILVALRFFTLPFSLYFLIVFIPFLPLAVAAMLLAGAGILLLAPVLNFILHVYRISQDFSNKEIFPTASSRWLTAVPVLLLPLILHLNYLCDRHDLHKALAWVYAPDYSKRTTDVDAERISYVLEVVSSTEKNRRMFPNRKYWKPYLSTYYRWLVLDNLTLSGRKIADLERIFIGTNLNNPAQGLAQTSSPEIRIRSISKETRTDSSGKFYRTTLHLELENTSSQQQEFISSFSLPEGAWVSDYYLDIEKRREHGILAEKRTAQWVYRNIVNRRKDPGIISYLNGNELELRVFPLEAKEKRRTGLEIIHSGPLHFPFAGEFISVEKPLLSPATGSSVKMIPSEEKSNMPSIVRKKKYYLLIDNSLAVQELTEKKNLLDRVQNDLKILLDSGGPLQLFSVNHSAHALGLKAWRPLAEGHTPEGGFLFERIMKSVLIEHYNHTPELAPVFILYSRHAISAPKDLTDLSFTFPDVDQFFVSDSEKNYPLSYETKTAWNSPDSISSATALAIDYQPAKVCIWDEPSGKKFVLPVTGNSIVLLNDNYTELDKADNLWTKAAVQRGNIQFLQLHPELSEVHWRQLVAQNFETAILSPYTSYLVVETEAQKEVLRQKQKEVLNAAQYFDIEQEFISMSEPSWYWYLLIPLLVILAKKWKRKRAMNKYSTLQDF